jgi:cell division protein FtsN
MRDSLSIITVIVLLAVVSLVVGCSTSKETTKKTSKHREAGRKDTITVYEKDFDPSKYDVKEPKPTTRKGTAKSSREISRSELVMGFRVQVYQSTSVEQANQVKNDVSLLLQDTEVYMDYDSPNYKVRVGDFQTRAAANEMMNLLMEKGYKEAWVVPDRVYKTVQ